MNRPRRIISPVAAVVVGGALTLCAAAMASMTASDAAELSAIAAAVTLVGLGAGALVLHGLRARPLGTQIAAMTLTTIGSLMAGAFAASRAMFISSHDLGILSVVLIAAGTVGVSSALVMGRRIGVASTSLVDVARRVGNDGHAPTDMPQRRAPHELAQLARELDVMEERLNAAHGASEHSKRPAESWSRGCPTTCVRRLPECEPSSRRSKTA